MTHRIPSGRRPEVCVSLVSHGHGRYVAQICDDLARLCAGHISLRLTLNIPEQLAFDPDSLPYPVDVIRNPQPKGFGANHNAAFTHCDAPAFCILNPDIRLTADPFPPLLDALRLPGVGLVAPRIVSPTGANEDSARRFPSVLRLVARAVGLGPRIDYDLTRGTFSPDWVAGMFVLVRQDVFAAVGGFDERYFLYYEDVDLCRRVRRAGHDILCVPEVTAIHDAQRASRRNLRHLRWHLASMARFLASH